MQADEKNMRRLGQGGESPSSLEARAGAFLGGARETVGLTDAETAAIERRLLPRSRARRGLRLWPAFVVAVVLMIAGSVMAWVGGWRLPFVGGDVENKAPLPPAQAHPGRKPHRGADAVPSGAASSMAEPMEAEPKGAGSPPTSHPAPAIAPVPEPHAAVATRRAPRPEPSSSSESPGMAAPSAGLSTSPAEGPLSVEARSLAAALARWRRDRDGEAALALLGAHDRRFPHGAFSVESKVARAEILLALARRGEALAVLDSLSLVSLPRARELQTLRGELRANAGRCRDARQDLTAVLASTATDELGRRASRAIARCP
jgi:hypothetical protein